MDWAKTTARGDEKHLSFEIWCDLYKRFYGRLIMVSYSSSFSNALSVSQNTRSTQNEQRTQINYSSWSKFWQLDVKWDYAMVCNRLLRWSKTTRKDRYILHGTLWMSSLSIANNICNVILFEAIFIYIYISIPFFITWFKLDSTRRKASEICLRPPLDIYSHTFSR